MTEEEKFVDEFHDKMLAEAKLKGLDARLIKFNIVKLILKCARKDREIDLLFNIRNRGYDEYQNYLNGEDDEVEEA